MNGAGSGAGAGAGSGAGPGSGAAGGMAGNGIGMGPPVGMLIFMCGDAPTLKMYIPEGSLDKFRRDSSGMIVLPPGSAIESVGTYQVAGQPGFLPGNNVAGAEAPPFPINFGVLSANGFPGVIFPPSISIFPWLATAPEPTATAAAPAPPSMASPSPSVPGPSSGPRTAAVPKPSSGPRAAAVAGPSSGPRAAAVPGPLSGPRAAAVPGPSSRPSTAAAAASLASPSPSVPGPSSGPPPGYTNAQVVPAPSTGVAFCAVPNCKECQLIQEGQGDLPRLLEQRTLELHTSSMKLLLKDMDIQHLQRQLSDLRMGKEETLGKKAFIPVKLTDKMLHDLCTQLLKLFVKMDTMHRKKMGLPRDLQTPLTVELQAIPGMENEHRPRGVPACTAALYSNSMNILLATDALLDAIEYPHRNPGRVNTSITVVPKPVEATGKATGFFRPGKNLPKPGAAAGTTPAKPNASAGIPPVQIPPKPNEAVGTFPTQPFSIIRALLKGEITSPFGPSNEAVWETPTPGMNNGGDGPSAGKGADGGMTVPSKRPPPLTRAPAPSSSAAVGGTLGQPPQLTKAPIACEVQEPVVPVFVPGLSPVEETGEKRTCPFCSILVTAQNLADHLVTTHSSRDYVCPGCRKKCGYFNVFETHVIGCKELAKPAKGKKRRHKK